MTDALYAPAAAGIKAALDTVTDVGVTFDWAPLPLADWAAFVERFLWIPEIPAVGEAPDPEVRAWSVAMTGERRAYRTAGYGRVMREVTFLVRGHLSMRDDTEPTFRELVGAVATALDSDPSLGETCIDHDACDVSIPDKGAGLFLGDVLVHYAEITVVARIEQALTLS